MTALVCSVQLAVDFQTRSATLASGNGESMEKFNLLESLRKSSIQLCPTSTSMYITYSDLRIWGCSALLHQKDPKGIVRACQGKWT